MGKPLISMYDRMMAVRRIFSAMRGRRIHSQGLSFSRIAEVSVILLLTIALAFAQVSPIHTVAAVKPQPPSSTSTNWAKAYDVPYSYSIAESVAQTNSGGFLVGALCTAGAVTTPNCNTVSDEGRLKRKHSISDSIPIHELSILYTIGSHPTDPGWRRHLRGQRSIRLSRNRTDQLCPNRQTGFERERSMVKRPPILHHMLRGPPHVAVRPRVNHRRGIRGSRLHLRAHLQLQRVHCEAQLNRADSVAARLPGPEQPVLRSLLCPSDP